MRTYNYETISDMIQPLMEMMRNQHPVNAELVITPEYAEIRYIHTDLNFLSKPEAKNGEPEPKCEKPSREQLRNELLEALYETLRITVDCVPDIDNINSMNAEYGYLRGKIRAIDVAISRLTKPQGGDSP